MGASPQPSGKLRATEGGRDLVLARSFAAGIEEIWAELTESERTAGWFGPWSGDGEPGGTISVRMSFEQGEPEMAMSIDACEHPCHLALHSEDEHGSWHLEVELSDAGGTTTLELTHHLDEQAQPGMIGPGWEYYLDMLVAAHAGQPLPSFDDYFPAQQAYYESLVRE
ncbi:MAG TPA: SRPBCC family protein [Solirubrobacterales bacterium]|nr:SRPBCC family protein [Solirubrobacterales bacterium]